MFTPNIEIQCVFSKKLCVFPQIRTLSGALPSDETTYEEFCIPRDSPTVGKGGIKIFLTITASKSWDVKTTLCYHC